MFSYGLVHGDFGHLFFNMLTLFFFGRVQDNTSWLSSGTVSKFSCMCSYMSRPGRVLNLGSCQVPEQPVVRRSWCIGAVSAILFASILFEPKMGIYIYLIQYPSRGISSSSLPSLLLVDDETRTGQYRTHCPFLGVQFTGFFSP